MASGKLLMTSSSLSNQYCGVTPVRGGDPDLVQFARMDCPFPADQGRICICVHVPVQKISPFASLTWSGEASV